MIELLVPAEPPQLSELAGQRARFDAEVRPELARQPSASSLAAACRPLLEIEGPQARPRLAAAVLSIPTMPPR
jgi:hypothetical protein